MLGFQAEPGALLVHGTALPAERSVQEVASVELHSRLGGQYLHHPPGGRLLDACSEHERILLAAIDHEIVVVAASICDLLVVLVIDPFADTDRPVLPKTAFAFILFFARQAPGPFVLLLIAGGLTGAVDAALYWALGKIIDMLETTTPTALLVDYGWAILAYLVLILVARATAMIFQTVVEEQTIAPNFYQRVRWQTFRRVIEQPYTFFQNDFAGRIATKITQGAEATGDFIISSLQTVWGFATFLVLSATIMFSVDPWMLAVLAPGVFGAEQTPWLVTGCVVLFCLLTALLIGYFSQRGGINFDAVVGIFLVASLAFAAEAYARVGIAVSDAFIGCWHAKYVYNLVRPVTYIRAEIDESWMPIINTPPFPEYPSGHSVQSAAAAAVLSALFGDAYTFTDHSHDDLNLQARRFTSFSSMAQEAALSRMYAGIHYRSAIEQGLIQGRCIGEQVNALNFRRPG